MADETAPRVRRPQDAEVIRTKARRIRKEAEDATTQAVRAAEETGELRHLYGRPLDLSDNSPEWFAHKLLKREGVAPPAIERARDIDRAQQEAEAILNRLRRRRAWLIDPDVGYTAAQAQDFNRRRASGLEDYRAALAAINRAILDYNLTAPPALHRYGIRVEETMQRTAREIPPLPAPTAQPTATNESGSSQPQRRTFWRRFRR